MKSSYGISVSPRCSILYGFPKGVQPAGALQIPPPKKYSTPFITMPVCHIPSTYFFIIIYENCQAIP